MAGVDTAITIAATAVMAGVVVAITIAVMVAMDMGIVALAGAGIPSLVMALDLVTGDTVVRISPWRPVGVIPCKHSPLN